ncbi:MAG: extracellular solute-binding protein [Spirochaetaceae bacterium]|nr:extracellular solute-binding protein [Spirochaetaceae bacterium]
MKMEKRRSRARGVLGAAVLSAVACMVLGCGGEKKNPNPAGAKEFTVLTMRWGDMGDRFTQNQWLKDLEARTGVTIHWQVVSNTDWNEQKSIMLAGGELPDMVFGNMTFNDSDIINNIEYFVPLDDLIDEYMPNYAKAIKTIPALGAVTVFPDGKKYALAKNLPARPAVRNQPVINTRWLERLGLEVPTTLEELTTVLRAFKEQDANGNGDPHDEIPLSFGSDYAADLLNPFGINSYRDPTNGICSIDGQFVFYETHEQYRKGIKWLHELYREGILDPEAFTQDDQMLNGKRQAAEVSRIGFDYQWSTDAVFGKWSDEYRIIAPIRGPDGKAYAFGENTGVFSIQRNEVLITRACKDPAAAAAWVDNFYESEASIQNFWGALGTVITKHDDGTYTLKDPPAGTSADAWYWDQSLRDFGPKYIEPGFNDRIRLNPATGDGLKLEVAKLAEGMVTDPYPDVIHTAEETAELATLASDLFSYTAQMRAQWVTRGGIDAQWEGYLAQLERMGLARYREIKMAALERMR